MDIEEENRRAHDKAMEALSWVGLGFPPPDSFDDGDDLPSPGVWWTILTIVLIVAIVGGIVAAIVLAQ